MTTATAARVPPTASGLPALPLAHGLFSTNLCSFRRDILTMNTIKSILLGTTLLALAGLCNQPARADGTYTATVSGVTPQSGSDAVVFGYQGSNPLPATIPVRVAKLFVQVNGATPSRTIYVNWAMSVQLIVHTTSGSSTGTYIAQSSSNGLAPVLTGQDGSWTRDVKDGTSTSFSQNYATTQVGSWVINADCAIPDLPGVPTSAPRATGAFTTVAQYVV